MREARKGGHPRGRGMDCQGFEVDDVALKKG